MNTNKFLISIIVMAVGIIVDEDSDIHEVSGTNNRAYIPIQAQ